MHLPFSTSDGIYAQGLEQKDNDPEVPHGMNSEFKWPQTISYRDDISSTDVQGCWVMEVPKILQSSDFQDS